MAVAPQNIMAQLRGMPDAQLAQYAAMHKNDPFIFPLAFQESQTRKQLRSAKEAQLAGVPQPKVVDQDLQQMMPQPAPVQQTAQLPENIGIGQLPAQNLTRMADGGIVAFEEGGHVPSYAGDTDGSLVRNPFAYLNPADRFADIQDYFKRQQIEAAKRGTGNLTGVQQNFEIPESTIKGTGDTTAVDQMAVDMAKSQKKKGSPNANAGLTMAGSGKDKGEGGGKASTGAAPASGLPALATGYTATTPEEMMKTSRAMAADANAESDTAYKPYAEMLQKERGDLEKRKGDNVNMALLQAGLGILGGTSRYAMQNIGQGGMQGIQAYNEAKRADDAAKKALMGSEIALMQAQRAERSGNHKDAVALLGQAEQSKQFGITAGLKAEEIKNTAAYQQGMIGVQQGRNAILGASNRQAEKQMAEFGKIQNAVTKSLANDMVYAGLKTDAERQAYKTKLLNQEIANNPFLSALGAGVGFVPKMPAGGQMRGDYTE